MSTCMPAPGRPGPRAGRCAGPAQRGCVPARLEPRSRRVGWMLGLPELVAAARRAARAELLATSRDGAAITITIGGDCGAELAPTGHATRRTGATWLSCGSTRTPISTRRVGAARERSTAWCCASRWATACPRGARAGRGTGGGTAP